MVTVYGVFLFCDQL